MLCRIRSQYLGQRLLRAEEISLLYVASAEKLKAQSNQYDLQIQTAATRSGFLVILGSFRAVLDTYQVFGIIRRDPETVLVPPTTTRIPGRIIRTGTEGLRLLGLLQTVRAQSVRSPCAVTQSRRPHFVIPRTWMLMPMVFLFTGEQSIKDSSLLNSDPSALLHTDLISPIFG